MNGHNTEPPDKHQPDDILTQLSEMEMKQEPSIKLEPEDGDGIVTVSRSTHTSIFVTLYDSIGIEDFVGLCDSDVVKPEIKIEKVKKGGDSVPEKSYGKNKLQKTHKKKQFSKKKKQKSSRLDGMQKKSAAEIRKKRKTNKEDKKKKKKKVAKKVKQKKQKCSLCEYVTAKKGNLKTHMLTHTGERPFPCSFCQKRFTKKRILQSHMKLHVDDFLFSCSTCLQGFYHNEEKVEHEAVCTIRRYECHHCKEYSTLHKTNLENHLRVHSGNRPFECDHCSKKFKNASNLKKHRKTHINPRSLKFKCSVCFKIFKQQMEKENHEANCKRCGYKCNMCKSFTTDRKSVLLNHMRIHTGEKPFRCEICSKNFTVKGNLTKHKKIHK